MNAIVFHAVGDIRLEKVPEPTIKDPNDAIVRITSSAICGTDLHFIRGTFTGMKKGRILGHEAVGIVEEEGKAVRNFRRGDRVIIPSTLGCGSCNYCRAGFYAQCNVINPAGPLAGQSSSAARKQPAVSMAFRPSTRACHMPPPTWCCSRRRSLTIRPS